jgi:hypothetical protein
VEESFGCGGTERLSVLEQKHYDVHNFAACEAQRHEVADMKG